ncbi:MAG: arginyltransferase [Pseudomonadota bacterium]
MKFGDSQLFQSGYRRALRFYMTAPAPCPYIDGMRERKAFTNLSVPDADAVHSLLSESGFRRSQGIAYRPACPRCNACKSVRVPVRDFSFTKRWRRVLSRNDSIVATAVPAVATREQYRLLRRYLMARHEDGGMADMSFRDYANMVSESPVKSMIVEYREGPEDDAPLIGAAISDVLRDGLSMVYSFFDPKLSARSLGSFMILEHIQRATAHGLPHVYLGFWVEGSPKMDYKRQFWPLEVLNGETWQLVSAERTQQ